MPKKTFTNANILTAEVNTNCPRGGDAGHGGVTELRLSDDASTCWEVELDGKLYDEPREFVLRLRGDTENETLTEALQWAGEQLDQLTQSNRAALRRDGVRDVYTHPEESLPEFVKTHWPPHLQKAAYDEYSYTLALKDGTQIEFENARPLMDGEWVQLNGATVPGVKASTGRGVQVRLSEIAWVLDHDS